MDQNRQWFKACYGLGTRQTPREISFCAHVLLSRQVMIVPDTLLDPRFADNPLVTEAPHIRFYAGTPLLLLPNGSCVGTLCIIDTRPRHLDAAHVDLLQALGSLVQEELSAGAHA